MQVDSASRSRATSVHEDARHARADAAQDLVGDGASEVGHSSADDLLVTLAPEQHHVVANVNRVVTARR